MSRESLAQARALFRPFECYYQNMKLAFSKKPRIFRPIKMLKNVIFCYDSLKMTNPPPLPLVADRLSHKKVGFSEYQPIIQLREILRPPHWTKSCRALRSRVDFLERIHTLAFKISEAAVPACVAKGIYLKGFPTLPAPIYSVFATDDHADIHADTCPRLRVGKVDETFGNCLLAYKWNPPRPHPAPWGDNADTHAGTSPYTDLLGQVPFTCILH